MVSWIKRAVLSLRRGQIDQFRQMLTAFLASIPYSMRRKDEERERERYFQYTFYLLLRLMSVYTIYIEKEQSEGRVDCVIETPQFVYIFEFKLDGTAASSKRRSSSISLSSSSMARRRGRCSRLRTKAMRASTRPMRDQFTKLG